MQKTKEDSTATKDESTAVELEAKV